MFIFKKFFSLLIFIIFLTTTFNFCLAQENGKPLEIQYPVIGNETVPAYTTTLLPDYIKYIFYLAISIAGLLAFGALIYGGVRWLTSAGNPASMSDAKDQIFAGILGLVVLLSSWLVLNTINPQLVVLKSPEIVALPTPSPLPSLHEGDVCLYDKQYDASDKQVLACYTRDKENYVGATNLEGIGIVKSIEIKRDVDAVGIFEGTDYSGKRVCFKKDTTINGCGPSDLTKCSFVAGSSVFFNDLTDDIKGLIVLPAEKCSLPGIVLPQGSKDYFGAVALFYGNKDFKEPTLFAPSGKFSASTSLQGVIWSIEIKDPSLAVKLYSQGGGKGKSICFTKSIRDLSSCVYAKLLWIIPQNWTGLGVVQGLEVVDAGQCQNAGQTIEENGDICTTCGGCQ